MITFQLFIEFFFKLEEKEKQKTSQNSSQIPRIEVPSYRARTSLLSSAASHSVLRKKKKQARITYVW